MPLNRYVVRVDPQGQTVTVDVLDTSGASVVTYDSPQFAAATQTLPLVITKQTDFWLHSPGPYDVSCKVGGAEVADAGAPKRVQVSDVPVLVVPDWERERAASGGSVAPGVPVVRTFTFAFNTPGLVAGHSLYTPTIGDLILDAILFVNTAWDGTTPFADIGTFTNGTQGWFFNQGQFGTSVYLADGLGHASSDTLNKVNGAVVRLSAFDTMTNAIQALQVSGTDLVDKANASNASSSSVPILIQQADPIKVCVSTTGQTDGSATDSADGDCTLYLVTCTPAT